MDPDAWPVPIETVIARGADSDAVLAASSAVERGVVEATRKLDGHAQMIIGACGFFWSAGRELSGSVATPTLLSAIDLVDLALKMTTHPIGIVTFSEPALDRLFVDHPYRHRMRLVGLDDLPDWACVGPVDYMERGGWTMEGLSDQLAERLKAELEGGGCLADVRLLILECTCLANFRKAIREVTPLPMLDVASFAAAALG